MFGLLLLLVIAAVLVGIYFLAQQGKASPSASNERDRNEAPTIFNLRIGDFVQYMGTDWAVEGKLTYSSNGYSWLEYMLQDGNGIRWMSVEEDDLVEVTWTEPVSDNQISGLPPNPITFQGEQYRLTESGEAVMIRSGGTINKRAERCKYYEYEGTENKVLSIEDWGSEMEVNAGLKINPRLLELLPGDGKSVYNS
ncbi:hypothetical protein Pse7367_0557 [Thalassoporum mexicanum PCC 7367]|uniref:DUF4178 domain-containing protein n=1 Tax=Thalassoporum mexicanum TaxID=3457544 RepID=UPI00029F90CF|nr:DUF4178 domain-containing protein [Pseudanabaena sp. PCC 7367]AFY68862.1 hypothetical protein Pse7367_0557 [Pseudanabaena sp. PCC 7367]